MKNKDNIYLPRERSWYIPDEDALVSGPEDGVKTTLANTATDPIVVNDIACNEFDYTEDSTISDETNSNP